MKAGLVSHHQLLIGNLQVNSDAVGTAIMLDSWSLNNYTQLMIPLKSR